MNYPSFVSTSNENKTDMIMMNEKNLQKNYRITRRNNIVGSS